MSEQMNEQKNGQENVQADGKAKNQTGEQIREKVLEVLDIAINEVRKVIVGKDEIIRKVMIAILADGHVLMEDYPGVGKTTLALGFSRALSLNHRRMQFTPDVMPSDVTGFSMYNKKTDEFEYREGVIMCNLLLADEINRTSPKTQSALLEAMEEGNVTVDGVKHELPKPFLVIATQNPIGSAGTSMLPESQLDRFMMKLYMGYPGLSDEVTLMRRKRDGNPMDKVRGIMSGELIMRVQELVNSVYVSDSIYQYIAELVHKTRENTNVLLGASPRGSLALLSASKANAFLRGRDYVITEDVRDMFFDVINHRIILSPEAKYQNVEVKNVLDEIIRAVPAPR